MTKLYKSANVLRSYQLEGLNWILRCFYQKRSCILADEMGLGKTVQVATTLEHLFTREQMPGPFLVVVPLSTIDQWQRHLNEWTDMVTCMYHDPGGAKVSGTVQGVYCYDFQRPRIQELTLP